MTFSLTATPPGTPGIGPLKSTWKSWRLIWVVAEKPATGAAVGVRAEAVDLKLEGDGLRDVLDGQVALEEEPSSACLMPVETKVISGYFSTSKKSALRMCASRCSWPVLIELRSTLAVTGEAKRVFGQ